MTTAIRSLFDMNQLHQYDTPETDWLLDSIGDPPYSMNPRNVKCRELEQRLAACRDALTLVIQRGEGMQNSDEYLYEVLHTCRKTLTLTAPK